MKGKLTNEDDKNEKDSEDSEENEGNWWILSIHYASLIYKIIKFILMINGF